jgi:hypothetical protein
LWQLSQLLAVIPVTDLYGIWFTTGPSAGGLAPEWHVAHCPLTTNWLWFHSVGFQPVVLWHVVHVAFPIGICVLGRPVAVLPL